jgi:thioredoxin reductase (NADPH)
MTAYGVAQPVEVGDIVVRPGDVDYDLILVESGWIEILSPAIGDEPESVVARYGSGGFLGELNFLTGQTAYLMARVSDAGRIHRISRERFRRLMATEPDLSDILLRTFLARRDLLREGPAARALAIVGSELSAESLALRTFAARQRLAHLWLDADSAAGQALAQSAQIGAADLPAVITAHQVLRRATTGQMAQALGLAYRHSATTPADLIVVGSGPAGLAAAV